MALVIYVYLPGEAVDAWAPVDAEHVGDDLYRIIDCRDEDDQLQFGKGSVVRCRREEKMEGTKLVDSVVAYEEVQIH